MDSCVRCLRDGGADGSASVVLLLDEVEGCYGGDAVLEQVFIVHLECPGCIAVEDQRADTCWLLLLLLLL
jgi:hypothetical protein